MESLTLRATIKNKTKEHLELNNGMVLGQCLSAIGWVDGTVPDTKNLVELPMTDVAGAEFAVGAAIAGRRPILVIRFQDFMLLNGTAIVNVASRRKFLFDEPAPVFVRILAREGLGSGISHSGKLHSTFAHFPGIRIWCPITPTEWTKCWEEYMKYTDPMLCFEHRATFDNIEDKKDKIVEGSEIAIFSISTARMNAEVAVEDLDKQGITASHIHLYKLKPFCALDYCIEVLKKSKIGLVVDNTYETCGMARDIAYQLMTATGKMVYAMGLEERQVGVAERYENSTPSTKKIIKAVKELVYNEKI